MLKYFKYSVNTYTFSIQSYICRMNTLTLAMFLVARMTMLSMIRPRVCSYNCRGVKNSL